MAFIISRGYGMLRLLVCVAVLVLPAGVFAECRVIEYPDRNEVVCEEDAQPQAGQLRRKEASKAETTRQKEFVFYAPVNPVTKITISADLSPFAIASPGDTLLSYRADVLINKVYRTTTASFVYEERSGDAMFTIREDGTGDRADDQKITSVIFNDKKSHLLLVPFRSGCPSGAADAVYLKMNRIEGSQLYYQIVLPPCLSKLVEQSITD
jgi:hypothetical protein